MRTGRFGLLAAALLIWLALAAGLTSQPALASHHAATVSVTPAIGLRNGQSVRVAIDGFPAAAKVYLTECSTDAQARAAKICPDGSEGAVAMVSDHRGVGQTRYAVSRGVLHDHDVRCQTQCVLDASTGKGGVVAVAAIWFGSSELPLTGSAITGPAVLSGVLLLLLGVLCLVMARQPGCNPGS